MLELCPSRQSFIILPVFLTSVCYQFRDSQISESVERSRHSQEYGEAN